VTLRVIATDADVPLFVIDDAVEKIKDGTITAYVYDPKLARLIQREGDITSVTG
jgi:hypothetical protein